MSISRQPVLAAGLLLAACAIAPLGAEDPPQQASPPAERPKYDFEPPYIGGPLPGGERLIHPLPEAGSTRLEMDREANAHAISLRGSARWQLATQDADLGEGWYGRAFSCAAGVKISAETTPHIAHLLRRAGADFGMSTSAVKAQFQRLRPFMENGEPTCTPQDEEALRSNGSYPSGHSAIGYGTALVLANLFPEQAAVLLARGRAYGNSRWVCNLHWYSDTQESHAFAVATFARLQSNKEFRADLELARLEASSLDAAPESEICGIETAVLVGQPEED